MATTGGVTAKDPAWQFLDQTRDVMDRELQAALERLQEPTRTVARYHFGWCDEYGRPTNDGAGKAVRPALVRLCAQAVGAAPEQVVSAAVAVELAHNFTLLHDDIIDGDELRRHRRTVWTVFGTSAAILAGDALLVLAMDLLAANPGQKAAQTVRLLCGSLKETITGQDADLSFERREDVSLEECVVMARNKTASLLGFACAAGASLAGASASQVDHLREFGYHLGLAFQLVDDLLGIWGDPAVTGKPRGSDLRAGKKSLPVVAALTAGSQVGARFAELYLRPEPLSEAEIILATNLIEQAGGRRWAQEAADKNMDTALSCLRRADPEPEAAANLVALAQLITHRNR